MACINVEIIEIYMHPIYGGPFIYYDRKWTYRASISDGSLVTSDTTIYLTYTGSTAIYGTSFLAPTKVIIKNGRNYVDFEIDVLNHKTTYGKYISLSGSSVELLSCGIVEMPLLSYKSTPKNEYDEVYREPGKDCCLFYDKTHETWRDYYPTCMGSNGAPKFPGNLETDGTQSSYDWYDSELYK